MKTSMQKKAEIKRVWHLIDLSQEPLGRLSTKIAGLLMGKGKSTYTPHIDGGDFVVAINSDNLVMTGHKMDKKMYYSHSGHPGGFKEEKLGDMMMRDSRKVVEKAVAGMLPKNKLQDPRLRRLKVFKGSEHTFTNHFNEKKDMPKQAGE